MLVDLLDALVEGDGEVGQRTQVTPFIFTLLWEAEKKKKSLRQLCVFTTTATTIHRAAKSILEAFQS